MADGAASPEPVREARLTRLLLVASFVWAFADGSNFLQVSSWMVGDIAYHRGVAYTMLGVDWQGEGPFAGLLTYYGGIYPLVLGHLAAWLGTTFDTVLSVASWFLPLLWPLAWWSLGRRIWPGQRLATAVFVLLATTVAPFTNRDLVWVDSPLASAQNTFPTYPRDIALILVVVAAACALSGSRRTRVVGTGLAVGGIILVHLQIGLLTGWLLVAWAGWRSARSRVIAPLGEVVASGVIALALSAWWWIPRVAATLKSGGLWLGGYPGTPPLRLGPDNVFMAFGVVGILALLGFAVLATRRPLPGALTPFLVWICAFVPLVVADRLTNGFDLLSERRVWLLVSVPLTVVAAATAMLLMRKLRPIAMAGFVALVLVAPSMPGTVATWRLVRDAWAAGHAGGRVFDAAAWDPIFADLRQRVSTTGRHIVLTYDAYEPWVWSFSGAQVPSLWLPGPFKLGFDPERMTGESYLDRLHAQEAAFAGGRAAVCAFARASSAGSVILDVEQGSLGMYDTSPASAYRVNPRDRDVDTISRVIATGVSYEDRGGQDVLQLAAGGRWQLTWQAPSTRLVAVEFNVPVFPPGTPAGTVTKAPLGEIVTALGRTSFGQGLLPGPGRVVVPVSGVAGDVTFVASSDVDLVRVTGFEAVPDVPLPIAEGPVRLSPDQLCPP
jgi:hypothetical protein